MTLETIIKQLDLRPLPVEGGQYRETYVAAESIPSHCLPQRYSSRKPFSTAIYYLLTDSVDSFSALHRLPSDEVWHFYLGDPVELVLLFRDGRGERRILGQDILNGQLVQTTVFRETWQGARISAGGKFALMGTTVAPGFEPIDYVQGDRESLIAQYPTFSETIRTLTRD